jgi:hypothetical protein
MAHGEHLEEIHVDHPHSYDHSEPKAGFIALFGIGTVVTLLLTAVAIQFYLEQSREQRIYEQVLAPEGQQLKEQRTREDQALGSYGYTDRATNKVRIPVQRSMDLMVQEAAQGKYSWNTTPYRVKTAEELAAGGPATNTPPPTQAPAQGPGLAQGNQSNDPSAAKGNR